jgi:pimeloyl-ACP methyl ester carboxylesterase
MRIACLLLAVFFHGLVFADDLPRRADLGAAIAGPTDTKGASIVRFRPGGVLEAAGLRVGDEVIAIDGVALTAERFGPVIRSLRGGRTVKVSWRRGSETGDATIRLPAMKIEAIDGVEVRYGSARSDKGYRVRTYTTRPRGAEGRLPLVVFIPWLSCSPAENPFPTADGWMKMLHAVARDSGAQLVRIEKPGVGDSEGPDCSAADLDHDMAAFRAGIRAALADPGVDPARLHLFGGSIGGALVPVLAREFRARGLVVAGGFARTWYEHMLDIERRRLTLSGRKPAEVNAAMRMFIPFYDRVLIAGDTPAQALQRDPSWAAHWYDAPAHQYGRPIRYYQQVQALDVEGAFAAAGVPALVVWGEYDWIMGRDESERVAAILGDKATYVVRKGMNHHFDTFPDAKKAFDEEGGTYDEGAARAIADWLRRN